MKKLLAILLCFCFVFSLAACGQTEEEKAESAKQAFAEFSAAINAESVAVANTRLITDANGDRMLTADIINNSEETVSEIILCFAIYDANGTPMVIKSMRNPGNEIYEFLLEVTDETVEAGATWSKNKGIYLDASCGEIGFQKAVVKSYKKADGTVYENPHYNAWKETYLQVNLDEYKR